MQLSRPRSSRRQLISLRLGRDLAVLLLALASVSPSRGQDKLTATRLAEKFVLHNVVTLLAGEKPDDPQLRDSSQTEVAYAELMEFPAEGLWLTRVPQVVRLQLNDNAYVAALRGAGVEFRTVIKPGGKAVLTLSCPQRSTVGEIWQGDYFVKAFIIGQSPTSIEIEAAVSLPLLAAQSAEVGRAFDPAVIRISLPYIPAVKIHGLTGEGVPPSRAQLPARRYLAYGSSITNGAFAYAPGHHHTPHLPRRLRSDLINLGFGGGACLEPAMADFIASRSDWDFATLEMGINILGNEKLSGEAFKARAREFIRRIVAGAGGRPVFCIDLFLCQADLVKDPLVARYRAAIQELVAEISVPNLHYINGSEILESTTLLSADLVHPSPDGMTVVAARLADRITPWLEGPTRLTK